MVYRLLQVDPETAAIHVNLSEIRRHPSNEAFLSALAHFAARQTSERIRELLHIPESADRAREISMLSHLVHEARHHFDMILTPFGFYRIRAAFEFYSLAPHLLGDDAPRIVLPLALNLDDVYRDYYDLNHANAAMESIFRLVRNRHDIILSDNKKERLADGTLVSMGGDAIMEALAYSTGCEFVNQLFDDPWVRQIHPIAFDGDHGLQLQATYAWHFSLARLLQQEPSRGTMRLVITLMFAALCGSTARKAKIVRITIDEGRPSQPRPSRDVTESIPSHRLQKLILFFADVADTLTFDELEPAEIVDLVDAACVSLFGLGFQEEIAADLAADEALLEVSQKEATEFPFKAFSDLVRYRRSLFSAFLNDPSDFISPIKFIGAFDHHCSPAILGCSPMGFLAEEGDDTDHILVEKVVSIPPSLAASIGRPVDEGKVLATRGIFVEILPGLDRNIYSRFEDWKLIWGFFCPLYKMGLYGARCRTLSEADVVVARDYLLRNHSNVVLDPYFDRPSDVSTPIDYFLFHELTSAHCDVCDRECGVEEMKWVSAKTFHSNARARARWLEQLSESARDIAVWRFELDFSGWKLCLPCIARLEFSPG